VHYFAVPSIHAFCAGNAAEGRPAENVIQNIETIMPAGGVRGDEAALEVGAPRQPLAVQEQFRKLAARSSSCGRVRPQRGILVV